MAVGAETKDILWMVTRRTIMLTTSGMTIGLAGSLAATRWMRSLLFEVQANDPATYASVAALLAVVIFAASYVPARRAAKCDPILALRQE